MHIYINKVEQALAINMSVKGAMINGKLVEELPDGGFGMMQDLMYAEKYITLYNGSSTYYIHPRNILYLKIPGKTKQQIYV